LSLVALTCSDCTKRRGAMIVRHPEWDYKEYRRVAVLPFQASQREGVAAAQQTEAYLVDLLAGSGAFEVLPRSDLKNVLTEQDLSRLADVADPNTALPEGQLQIAQAVIVGKITECELKQDRSERRIPVYRRDQHGRIILGRNGLPIVVGENVVTEFRNVARLGGTVRVIETATGRVLMSHSVPALEKDTARGGGPPKDSPEELAGALARELATEFYRYVAPQQIPIKLSSDCLVIASGYFEGKYEELKKVPTTLQNILLVARNLPKAADRNQFKLAIAPADGREYLFEHEFTWSPSQGKRGEAVEVPVSKLLENGGKTFVAKLFAAGDEQPILEKEFSLQAPKED
jgi:hypothetical protein